MHSHSDNKPYLIDAVTGNSRFLASHTATGRIVRLWWPHVDMAQHVDAVRCGLRPDGRASTSWFDGAEDGWTHRSVYMERTNIFEATAVSPSIPLEVTTAYYAVPGSDAFVFHHRITNVGPEPASFAFVWYSALRTAEQPYAHTTMFRHDRDALVHFRHDYYFLASSANVCTKYQCGNAWDNAVGGRLNGDDIQMDHTGAMEWRFEQVAPGATVELPIYLAAGRDLASAVSALDAVKSQPANDWLDATARYWRDFADAATACPIDEPAVRALYERSVLAMKLMADEATGSIVAAPEFDEAFTRCGGYAYCWGRDAAFITTALDAAGLTRLSDAFYDWVLTAQDDDGSWQQRHYHDGSLAPSWGLQIDEGASILWGIHRHYEALPEERREAFLAKVKDAARRGAEFLIGYIDEDNGLPRASRDLWEEREGQHTYSAAAVYGGLQAAASIAELTGDAAGAARCRRAASRVANDVLGRCWNEEAGVFYRGLSLRVDRDRYERETAQGAGGSTFVGPKGYVRYTLDRDPVVDVSLLGCAVPFAVVPPKDPRARSTADVIERMLTAPVVGGIKRYEDDRYIGGNPWILTTLWLAQYRAAVGQVAEARALLDWAVRHRTASGLLPEQVDRDTGAPAWVVPLTWSHAMFILAVHAIAEANGRA